MFKRLVAVIIIVVLVFTVVPFTFADTKSELVSKIQLLGQRIGRIEAECIYALPVIRQDLQDARAELQAVIDKEAKEKKK